MKKYQDLENKVKELQAEIERLKKEEKEEKEDKLPTHFNRDNALKFLKTYSDYDLHGAFSWGATPQGYDYWFNIYKSLRNTPKYVVSDVVIIQIQKWVILSYQND